jgi:hypothetical protein
MSEAHADMGAAAGTRGVAAGYTRDRTRGRSTAWVGWIWFAAVMMVLVGTFNVIYGLVALFEDRYYVVGPQGLLVFDLTQWGWIHLIVGAAAVVAGMALFSGALWARIIAVLLASVNAIAQLAFMPAYPAWSLIAIALDVVVIWAVIVHGDEAATESRAD